MDKIATLLQSLADKIGKTVEALWPEVVRYTVISGIVYTAVPMTFMIIAASILFYCRRQNWIERRNNGDEYLSVKMVAAILTGIFMAFTIFSSCEYLPRVIAPEGYLMNQMLQGVRR